ncbi:MAG: hypothetical protein IGS39_16950 [Calothrix sp. C42_A2020_038]|nr:hypothetical protein [Calothrix sp. C42_A2020_038]
MIMLSDFTGFLLATVFFSIVWLISKFFFRQHLWIILISFFVRLFIIFIHEETRLFGDYDISDYLPYFNEFSRIWDKDLIGYLKPHVPVYTVLYPGWIFNILGESGFWVIRVANATLGVVIIAPLTWLNQVIFGRPLKQFQVLLVLLWPTWLRYTVELGRAAPSVFAVVLGVSGMLAILSSSRIRNTIPVHFFTLVGVFLGFFLRIHYLSYFIPVASMAFLRQVQKSKISPYIRPILYFIGVIITLMVTFALLGLYQQFAQFRTTSSVLDSPEDALEYAQAREDGNSAYLLGIYPKNLLDLLWYIPLHAFYFMFSPMPWSIHGAFMAGSSLQSLILLILCIKVWRKGRTVIQSNQLLQLFFATILFVAIVFGSVTKNAGGAERWRLPSTLMLLTTSTSILAYSSKKENSRVLSDICAS